MPIILRTKVEVDQPSPRRAAEAEVICVNTAICSMPPEADVDLTFRERINKVKMVRR